MKKFSIVLTVFLISGLDQAMAQSQNNMSKGPMILQPVRTRIEDSMRKEFDGDSASLRYNEYGQANDTFHYKVNDSSRRNTFNLDARPAGIVPAVAPKKK